MNRITGNLEDLFILLLGDRYITIKNLPAQFTHLMLGVVELYCLLWYPPCLVVLSQRTGSQHVFLKWLVYIFP